MINPLIEPAFLQNWRSSSGLILALLLRTLFLICLPFQLHAKNYPNMYFCPHKNNIKPISEIDNAPQKLYYNQKYKQNCLHTIFCLSHPSLNTQILKLLSFPSSLFSIL